jgi:hypothetical protein
MVERISLSSHSGKDRFLTDTKAIKQYFQHLGNRWGIARTSIDYRSKR